MKIRHFALMLFALILTACGGGGGGSSSNSGGNNNGGTPTPGFSVQAGPDQTVDGGSEVTLQAILTGNATLEWQQLSGVSVSFDSNTNPTSFTAPQFACDTEFEFIVVASSANLTRSDTVQVLVKGTNEDPADGQVVSIDAGPDQVIVQGGTVVYLSAESSTNCGSLTGIQWLQTAGEPVDLYTGDYESANGANPVAFDAPFLDEDSTLVFSVTASGSSGNTATDSVNVLIKASSFPGAGQPVQVQTTYGTIEGLAANGVQNFLGIRFAAPPVGNLRFRPPQPPPFVSGVTHAKAPGPDCVQIPFPGRPYLGVVIGEEDCLFLNLWAPDDNGIHPVIVALHGGTNNFMDGATLARLTRMIVVAPARRVGVFGSLALQELEDESPDDTTSNYGLQDSIAALQWVQDNIASFGGDPQRVMLHGGSAGGAIACGLFAAPSAKGLFSSASVFSGVCVNRFVVDASQAALSEFQPLKQLHAAIISAAGCDNSADKLACLRSLTPEALLIAGDSLPSPSENGFLNPFGVQTVVDGVIVTTDAYSGLREELAGSFPLIAGSTLDEMRRLAAGLPIQTDDEFKAMLAAAYPDHVDEIFELYQTGNFATPNDKAFMYLSDIVFGCAAEALVNAASTNRPAFLYLATRGENPTDFVYHGSDAPFFWGFSGDIAGANISSAIQSGVTSLAADSQQLPFVQAGSFGNFFWPAYARADPQIIEFGDPVQIGLEYRGGRCSVLEGILPL